MLNARLYRTCWLVAGVALLVALLTLESPNRGPSPALPPSIDGEATFESAVRLSSIAPSRPPGSEADLAMAQEVRLNLDQLARIGGKVETQDFEARLGSQRVRLQNVYLAVPGEAGGAQRGAIVVIAPRDTPRGVEAGASSTAILLQLARASVNSRHQRPHLFVSTDGSTVGAAGIRWFLTRFSSYSIAAVVVLDGVGDAVGDRIHLWTSGTDSSSALGLGYLAREAVTRAGGRAEFAPGLVEQSMRLAVPQTFGEQGAVVAQGIPAVTLSGRADAPLAAGPAPTVERLQLVGNAAHDLLSVLDQPDSIPAPDAAVAMAGKTLRPTVARLAMLLLVVPLLVLAVDAVARVRRAKVALGPGMRAVALRIAPFAVALAVAHMLSLLGVLPGTAAGLWPQPADSGVAAIGVVGIVLVAGVGAVTWVMARRRVRAMQVPLRAEGAAGLALIALLGLVVWLAQPHTLVLILPAAHILLVASIAQRAWQVWLAMAAAVLPLVVLLQGMAERLDTGVPFAAWYLLVTSASGARGALGPLFVACALGCLWSLASYALHRARLVETGGTNRRRRPRVRLQIERTPRIRHRPH